MDYRKVSVKIAAICMLLLSVGLTACEGKTRLPYENRYAKEETAVQPEADTLFESGVKTDSSGDVGTNPDSSGGEGINPDSSGDIDANPDSSGDAGADPDASGDVDAKTDMSENVGVKSDRAADSMETSAVSSVKEKQLVLSAEKIDAMPGAKWQSEVTFPDWRGKVDQTLAANSMYSFVGRSGQGTIYVSLKDGTEKFGMYVNGIPVGTDGMTGGQSYRIDYSQAAINGRNTIQVSGIVPSELSDAVKVCIPYPVVVDGTRKEAGLADESIKLIEDLIASDIEYGFPSAQLSIVRGGKLVYENAWGLVNTYLPDGSKNETSAPVTTDTLYDLASVTKMFSVNYALQKLLTDGRIDLDAKIADFLGSRFYEDTIDLHYEKGVNPGLETQQKWKADLTIRDLLRHQGGFAADPRYFIPCLDAASQRYDPDAVNLLFAGNDGTQATREATIEAICKTPLYYEPGTKTVYSDVDYMILGVVVEMVTGKDLNTYLKETFWIPMGLSHLSYNPLLHGFSQADCAATELNGNTRDGAITFPGIRTNTIQGQVHDEKAYYSMGGISGHAGLFSNATDLAKLASVMLTGGYGNYRYFSKDVMDIFTAPKKEDAAGWGLGWWREGDGERIGYFGTQAGSDVIGHQGWTGTLVMIDKSRDLIIVYLTNKIHSPVTDKANNPNKFDGGWYTASTLGFVPQILSIGMDQGEDGGQDVSRQLMDLLYDMAVDSIRLIPQNAGENHPAVKNAGSKVSLFTARARAWEDDEYLPLSEALQKKIQNR